MEKTRKVQFNTKIKLENLLQHHRNANASQGFTF